VTGKPVVGQRPDALAALFGVRKPMIPTIQLPPLPGTPRYNGEPVDRSTPPRCSTPAGMPRAGGTA
jgi:hypothetical protein